MKKDFLIIFSIVILVALLIMGVDIQSVDEYYLSHLDDITEDSKTITLSVDCREIFKEDNYALLDSALKDGDYLPDDGVILAPTEYVLRDNDTVFDVLYRAVRHNKIPFEYSGNDDYSLGGVYVQGINYLYEFSCGETSGWIFFVNGKQAAKSCSEYALQDGDKIEWVYTCDLGLEFSTLDNVQKVGGAE